MLEIMRPCVAVAIAWIYFTVFSNDDNLIHLYDLLAMLCLLEIRFYRNEVTITGLVIVLHGFCVSIENFVLI